MLLKAIWGVTQRECVLLLDWRSEFQQPANIYLHMAAQAAKGFNRPVQVSWLLQCHMRSCWGRRILCQGQKGDEHCSDLHLVPRRTWMESRTTLMWDSRWWGTTGSHIQTKFSLHLWQCDYSYERGSQRLLQQARSADSHVATIHSMVQSHWDHLLTC